MTCLKVLVQLALAAMLLLPSAGSWAQPEDAGQAQPTPPSEQRATPTRLNRPAGQVPPTAADASGSTRHLVKDAGAHREEARDAVDAGRPAIVLDHTPGSEDAATRAAVATAASPQQLLLDQLRGLIAGTLEPEVDPRSLFAISLADLASVRRRVTELGRLQQDSVLAHQDLARQLATARSTPVQLTEPEILRQSLVAPTAPTTIELGPEPVAPKPPAGRRSKRMRAARRARWEKHDAAVAGYQQALANYQARQAEQQQRSRQHQEELAKYQTQIQARDQARAEHAAALDQARQIRARHLVDLEQRAADAAQRLEIVQLRLRYLDALQTRVDKLGAPAQRGFVALGEPHQALRQQRDRVLRLAAASRSLGQRLAILEARVQGGALVGFLVARERVLEGCQQASSQVASAIEASQRLADAMLAAAADMERQGRELQTLILRTVAQESVDPALDEAFMDHMVEMRRRRRSLGAGREDGSTVDVLALVERLEQTLREPAVVPSFTEAEQLLAAVGERQVEVMTLAEGRDQVLGRWQLAHERQVTATLEPLVSDTARRNAYALSIALLTELQDEIVELLGQLSSWVKKRLHDAVSVITFREPARSWAWLARLATLLVVVALTTWGRRFVPSLTSWLVRQVARLRVLKGRMGSVVRWAGLLQAMAPVLLYALAGELVLALLGTGHAEVAVLALLWRWAIMFMLGRQLLIGATRRVSRGRPALINVRESTLALLRLTYDRLILMLVITAAADDIVSRWLSSGQLRSLIDLVIIAGVLAWLVWGCFGWRALLGAAWARSLEEGHRLRSVTTWMLASRRGAVLSPVALIWLSVRGLWGWATRLSEQGGLSAFLRARELKRMARKTGDEGGVKLPPRYLEEFPLYPILGEESAAVLQRDVVVSPLLDQLQRWRETGVGGSVALIGEKGIGKSTLCGMFRQQVQGAEVLFHTLNHKVLEGDELARDLAAAFGADSVQDLDDLTRQLLGGDERVVIVDDAHNLFLRVVDGYRGFDAMVQLVNATGARVFWVLVFNRFAWQFINQSRKREHYFRNIVDMPRWSAAELQDLVGVRNRRSGFTVRFNELLLDDETGPSDQFQLIEGAEGFFRLLWESSRGNPRIATHLWLSALRSVDDSTLEVGLFRSADPGAFDHLGDELWFALAAICQHENLSAAELRDTLNVSADFAGFATSILREYGFIEAKRTNKQRVTLSPRYYRQVLDRLRSKHLLFEA